MLVNKWNLIIHRNSLNWTIWDINIQNKGDQYEKKA